MEFFQRGTRDALDREINPVYDVSYTRLWHFMLQQERWVIPVLHGFQREPRKPEVPGSYWHGSPVAEDCRMEKE